MIDTRMTVVQRSRPLSQGDRLTATSQATNPSKIAHISHSRTYQVGQPPLNRGVLPRDVPDTLRI